MNRYFISLVVWAFSQVGWSTSIELGVLPGLRYDIKQFVVRPSSELHIRFKNSDTMQHNLVITQPGKRQEVVDLALRLGANGPARHFVPDTPLVLQATRVIAMNQQAELKFKTPVEEGDYPFVCTFPGHGSFMHGIMKVSARAPRKIDRHRPELVADGKSWTPTSRPRIVRTWVPHASPAAIVVNLPGGQHYTWDAGVGHLRAVWRKGGGLDYASQRRHVESNGKPVVAYTQKPYYLEGRDFPFRLNDKLSEVDFKGYRLDKDGYPTFRCKVGQHLISEKIRTTSDGLGVERYFEIEPPVALTFMRPGAYTEQVTASKGIWEGDLLHLSAPESAAFRITIHE